MTNKEAASQLAVISIQAEGALQEALERGVVALNKQIPAMPINEEDKMWICPRCCNNLLGVWDEYPTKKKDLREGLPYCLSCGQKIDWSELNESQ